MDNILPSQFRGLSEKELRKEYQRLRRNAQRRLSSLERRGYERTVAYKFAKSRLSLLPQSKLSLRDLKYELYDLDIFLTRQNSTIAQAAALERKQIKALQQAGYSWITTSDDFRTFIDYMEYARAINAPRIVGSSETADELRELLEQGKTPDEIRGELLQWLESEAKAKEKARALSDIYLKSLGR